MVTLTSITTQTIVRCLQMGNFLIGVPILPVIHKLAATVWGAARVIMERFSTIQISQIHAFGSARPLVLCLISIGILQPVALVFAAERCSPANTTRVVSVQGNVAFSLPGRATTQAARLNQTLCAGDVVRVGAKSRAVLRLPNETTIPLDQNTIFQLKEPTSEKDPTLIELIKGAIHVITRTPKPFKVNTPFMNAAVEGTEFYVGVDEQEARVAVIEGKVNVSNEQGALLLTNNEAATARKGEAPVKVLTIKPRDAVQWALYYPPVITPRDKGGVTTPLFAESYALFNQGDTAEAIERLERIAESDRNADFYNYRASLLLHVGRADEAEGDINQALLRQANSSDALSLQTIIAIVKNDKAKAVELANQAVQSDPQSAAARIALSYALQANFKIEDALKAAREAILLVESNALAWARVAELELFIPNYNQSKQAAEQAVKLNPNLARTQSILGFANLTRIDIKAAKDNFNRAIELDQADPLPRLGLGLATIREGNLSEGREQIEIAASLDPENSLIRSYLGKAYYEEKRDEEAGKQFELAKERGPEDPTPYFYDAIRNQTENRPVEALQNLVTSIRLNDNRAVYRSRLLLDDDEAARSASLAGLYGDSGFEKLAVISSTKALADNPANYAAHLLLATAYANLPRHDIARVSEALQAQLRQPLAVSSSDPKLNTDNLAILRDTGPVQLGSGEFNQLFSRNQVRLDLDALSGSRDTRAGQFVLSGLANKIAFSVSGLHYDTEGFQENNEAKKDIYDVFLQGQLSHKSSLQLELKRTDLRVGETFYRFDPDFADPTNLAEQSDTLRLGGHHAPDASGEWLWSTIVEDRERTVTSDPDNFPLTGNKSKTYTLELQHVHSSGPFQLTLGLGHLKERDDFPLEQAQVRFRSSNAYAYGQWKSVDQHLIILAGLAADSVKVESSLLTNRIDRQRVSPKLGVVWSP
ncbi:MAG: FecR domain-containing protein, partial [Burkholderiales bacterium]